MSDQFWRVIKCEIMFSYIYNDFRSDCHSWWISKRQSGGEDSLEERYAIKFCFKLGKMIQKRMECFRLLFGHLAWIEHQFLSGIKDSRKARSLWGMMRSVGGVRKSIHRGVMVIVVGNEHSNTSSNLDKTDCISHSTNTLGKGMNPIILPPAMGKW